MKSRGCVKNSFKLGLVATALLVLPLVASAQDDTPKAVPALLSAGIIGFVVIICVLSYVYHSLAIQTIANKTNTENGWLAWIPIANLILLLNIARKPVWWIVLLLIPLVNIVVGIIVLMAVAEARNKPSWWGILWIIPPISIIVPGYLAWSD